MKWQKNSTEGRFIHIALWILKWNVWGQSLLWVLCKTTACRVCVLFLLLICCHWHDAGGLIFYNKPKTWIEALEICFSHNTTLVHITNDIVVGNVDSLLSDQGPSVHSVWIGLERSIFNCRAPWVWTGGPPVQFKRWWQNFPQDPVNYHCGKILYENSETNWLDAHCFERLPFICQGT